MIENYRTYDVVQFNEKHKWCACLGIIYEVKETKNDVKYIIGVHSPDGGTAYIYLLHSKEEFEYIGNAILVRE